MDESAGLSDKPPQRLRDALRVARLESAERTGVVVDLRDAEVARLELLDEALAPVFKEIPADVEMFDRGVSRGETPRLWIDPIAHIAWGREQRVYRLVQDTRYGRSVLAEATDVPGMVDAVTRYVASRLIERERALAVTSAPRELPSAPSRIRPQRRGRVVRAFLFGVVVGVAGLIAAVWFMAGRL